MVSSIVRCVFSLWSQTCFDSASKTIPATAKIMPVRRKAANFAKKRGLGNGSRTSRHRDEHGGDANHHPVEQTDLLRQIWKRKIEQAGNVEEDQDHGIHVLDEE